MALGCSQGRCWRPCGCGRGLALAFFMKGEASQGLDFEDWPLLPTSFLNMYVSLNIGDEEFA